MDNKLGPLRPDTIDTVTHKRIISRIFGPKRQGKNRSLMKITITGSMLQTWLLTLRFHNRQGISELARQYLLPKEEAT